MAELVNAGPLAGARMYGSGEKPVRQVRIVDELSVFGSVTPHTAVVLIGTAASGGWAVEMAMRRAWEQAAACVIAPSSGLSEGSGEVLAERLGVTLIFVDEDPLIIAVRVASVASRPDAARTQLVARCATRLAEAGTSPRRVLGVLNAELPGTSVAFIDRYGRHLAGRQSVVNRPAAGPDPGDPPAAPTPVENPEPPTGPGESSVQGTGPSVRSTGSPLRGAVPPVAHGGSSTESGGPTTGSAGLAAEGGEPSAGSAESSAGGGEAPVDGGGSSPRGGGSSARGGETATQGGGSPVQGGARGTGPRWSAEVEVLDRDGAPLGALVAGGSSRSPGWPSVVRTVLGLAVAPLTAWVAQERLRASRDFAMQAALAERLLADAEAAATTSAPTSAGTRAAASGATSTTTSAATSAAAPGETRGVTSAGTRGAVSPATSAGGTRGAASPATSAGATRGAASPATSAGTTRGTASPTSRPATSPTTRAGASAAPRAATSAATRAARSAVAAAATELEEEGGPRTVAIALGWTVEGPITGYHVRPLPAVDDTPLAQALITAAVGEVPVLPRGEGWAGWSALEPGKLAQRLEHCLEMLPWPCAAGVGTPVDDLAAAGESLLGAEAAAFVAGPGTVARADQMGPAELLGALPAGVLRAPAAVVLRPLLEIDKDGTLLETLAAVLDEGGALKAADRLGVHRNTITTRLDRIKSVGFNLDDAATRLALQLACHVMLR
ncbi:hypothetical protein GCM10022419_042510 [Nonomuraea rosea]|uniref:PucR C-terminal helix-turn-helix domain-containing protein n=1 Tax=Nonomuraea rosea TaxID=638574 RepID=A0ABP6WVJ8_9ACTN